MPFDTLKFSYDWRPYQEKVLKAVDAHLDDGRIHLVAAPGAGKTTLGLEIFRILKKPTLILSPTRVIRDQWIERLTDFCGGSDPRKLSWVSNSIRDPRILTSITYQALHAGFSEELTSKEEPDEALLLEEDDGLENNEINELLKTLEKHRIEVLILDEAHHLKAEWWRALDKVCKHLPGLTLVSLTATPPYDSKDHEWSRYEELCGPIDEEISVPELVKAGTLCPHQDFFWACNATESEKKQILDYDEQVSRLCHSLHENEKLEEIIASHPWLNREDIASEVIREPEVAIAILSFLKSKNINRGAGLMEILDLTNDDIPELGRAWWQELMEAVLFNKSFQLSQEQQDFVDDLKKQLRASALLYRRELSLERSRRLERSLSLSPAKIEACAAIHQHEFEVRGDSLRQVILTDFIRDEERKSELKTGERSLGAWPLFRNLIPTSPVPHEIGLLTGRLSIIHKSNLDRLMEHLNAERTSIEPLDVNGEYVRVTSPLNQLTGAFTNLLSDGDIKLLVGTRALLGEGWDAPSVNSLILASSVGSFMLTNQMRGRAIRIDPENPDKVSSIWHLAAINMKSYSGLSDFKNLQRRFETFVGLSEKNPTIESGFERMNAKSFLLGLSMADQIGVARNNREMRVRSSKLEDIRASWNTALVLEESARVIPSVEIERTPRLRGYVLKYSFQYLLTQLLGVLAGVFSFAFGLLQQKNPNISVALFLLSVGIAGGLLYKFPHTLGVVQTLFRFLPIDGGLKQIGTALAEALWEAEFIETSPKRFKVNVASREDGTFFLSLQGATFYESSLFADCLDEILSPIDSPRYLVIRKGTFLGQERTDYHAIPMKFGVKKELAEVFHRAWERYVSPSALVYTRTDLGRQILMKAKMKAFSSNFENQIKRLDRWQ